MTRLAMTVGLLAAMLVGGAGTAWAQDDELATLKARKLAEPFLRRAAWLLDYDRALAAATASNKLIFAYFTRSYAP